MGVLDGLEAFGLKGLKEVDLFEDPEAKKREQMQAEALEVKESDFLFDKTYNCPICDNEFKVKTVKNGKAKLIGTDMDLRPKHEGIDMIKYDVVVCPKCGYSTLTRYFKYITGAQGKLIKENISKVFKGIKESEETYSYDEALGRYKLALANAFVKQAKASEKAYICLKSAWLVRGKMEELDEKAPDYAAKKKECEALEKEYQKNALEGFMAARQKESYPMCGMDEGTVDYLIAVLAMEFDQYDVSSRLISNIIAMPGSNPRMKDKARDLKEILMTKIKEAKGSK